MISLRHLLLVGPSRLNLPGLTIAPHGVGRGISFTGDLRHDGD
ncbi:MAG: hypothetical protein WC734_06005 [Patescibacteria group bacterium]